MSAPIFAHLKPIPLHMSLQTVYCVGIFVFGDIFLNSIRCNIKFESHCTSEKPEKFDISQALNVYNHKLYKHFLPMAHELGKIQIIQTLTPHKSCLSQITVIIRPFLWLFDTIVTKQELITEITCYTSMQLPKINLCSMIPTVCVHLRCSTQLFCYTATLL